MKKILLLFFCFSTLNLSSQVFWTDTFEDSGAPSSGVRTVPNVGANGTECAVGDYHLRTNDLGGPGSTTNGGGFFILFSGQQGSHYWRIEDIDGGCSGNGSLATNPASIEYNDINIANLDGVELIISLVGRTSTAFETNTFLQIQYDINNSGSYTSAFCLAGKASPETGFFLDLDCDGVADGSVTISTTFTDYNIDITTATGAGDVMDLRIVTNVGAGEEIGLDNIRLNEKITVPVELVSFKLDKKDDLVNLFWTTASEINNKKFEIERSEDGISFRKIGEIQGIGTSSELQTYTFTDEKPTNELNYYRLKQIDYDGQFEFSKIISAYFRNDDRITIFPNPVDQFLHLSMAPDLYLNSKSTNRFIEIYNVHNMLIQSTPLSEKETDAVLDLSKLSSGVYFLCIKEGLHSIITKRIFKQ